MTAVHHPLLVDQFYRLELSDQAGSTKLVKTTRWNHTHADSSGHVINWDSKLCMAAGGAVLLDAQTGGVHTSSPGKVHDNQSDQSGGIGVDDVQRSLSHGWGQSVYVPDDFDWYDTLYAVKARRCCLIGVDYGYVPYDYQAQKGGDFPHAMIIEDWRPSDGRIKVYDSLATNPQWMPQSAIRSAAEALAQQERGTKARLFVAFSKVRPLLGTEPLFRVACVGGDAHPTPLYAAPADKYDGTGAKTHVSTATYQGPSACTRHKVSGQWWYQILPTAKTANRGLWISPTRYTKVDPL